MAYEQYWYAGGGNLRPGWTKASESFITGDAYTLVSVYLPLAQGLWTTGSAHIYLYAVDGSHYPTGSPLLTVGTITPGELTAGVQWIEFSGLSYSMLATTEYAIVIEIDDYDETYVDDENIPMIRWLSKTGYEGQASHQWWYQDNGTWRHTITYSVYAGEDFGFITVSGLPVPSAPINPIPAHEGETTALDDTILSWEDGGGAETYDVYFRTFGEFFEKIASDITDTFVDASIAHTPAFNGGRYTYGELYFWCVIAKNESGSNYSPPEDFGIGYGGTIWEFNAMEFRPPLPSGVTLSYAGDDDGVPTGTPTGGNLMIATRRLIAAANNKIWMEDI